MSPILHLGLAPDKMETDTAGIPQEEHIIDDLTNGKIVLATKGQTTMKSIGQKSHATRCKLKKEENWDEWLEAEKKQLDEMNKCNL
eukprot:379605-Ditylum_brightwellii.AAC.1